MLNEDYYIREFTGDYELEDSTYYHETFDFDEALELAYDLYKENCFLDDYYVVIEDSLDGIGPATVICQNGIFHGVEANKFFEKYL